MLQLGLNTGRSTWRNEGMQTQVGKRGRGDFSLRQSLNVKFQISQIPILLNCFCYNTRSKLGNIKRPNFLPKLRLTSLSALGKQKSGSTDLYKDVPFNTQFISLLNYISLINTVFYSV